MTYNYIRFNLFLFKNISSKHLYINLFISVDNYERLNRYLLKKIKEFVRTNGLIILPSSI